MTKIRTLIADDEPAAREKLRRLLAAHDDVEIVGDAATGRETVAAVRAHPPDLILLDIRMPDLDAFEALAAIASDEGPSPKVVFVTAYDEFALQAFEVRALDYLLKPYDATRLASALDRVREQLDLEHRPSPDAIESLVAQLRGGEPGDLDPPQSATYLDKLCIRSVGHVQWVSLDDVDWIEAYGNYVRLHRPGERPLARTTVRALLAQLDPRRFARIHRSAIVNVSRVMSLKPVTSGDAVVTLASGIRLRVSRSFRGDLDARLRDQSR